MPSVKQPQNYGTIHHFQLVNQLFLWPFSIALSVITRGYPSSSTRNGHSSTINGYSSTIIRRFSQSTSNLRTSWKEGEFKLVASQQSRLAHDHQMGLGQDVLCQVQPCGNYMFFLKTKSQWFLHIFCCQWFLHIIWIYMEVSETRAPRETIYWWIFHYHGGLGTPI